MSAKAMIDLFQSTPPARGATKSPRWRICKGGISIHAPREGGDINSTQGIATLLPFQSTPPARGATVHGAHRIRLHLYFNPRPPRGGRRCCFRNTTSARYFNPRPPRGGDSKDAQFYLRIFDKQVELLRFLGKIRGGCLRNPEKDRRFLGKSLANLPEISGHLDFAGGGKARPGYPCAVPLPRRAACVRGSGDPPADRCSSYRNAPLFSHIASPDSKSADCLSQDP